jgi:hypothetical protein
VFCHVVECGGPWPGGLVPTKKDQGDLPTGRTVLSQSPNCLFLIVDIFSTNKRCLFQAWSFYVYPTLLDPGTNLLFTTILLIKLFSILKEVTQAASGFLLVILKSKEAVMGKNPEWAVCKLNP